MEDQICQSTDKRADRTACMKPNPIKAKHKFARLQDNYRTVSVQKQNSHKAYLKKDTTDGFGCKQSTCFFLIDNQSEESTRIKKEQEAVNKINGMCSYLYRCSLNFLLSSVFYDVTTSHQGRKTTSNLSFLECLYEIHAFLMFSDWDFDQQTSNFVD